MHLKYVHTFVEQIPFTVTMHVASLANLCSNVQPIQITCVMRRNHSQTYTHTHLLLMLIHQQHLTDGTYKVHYILTRLQIFSPSAATHLYVDGMARGWRSIIYICTVHRCGGGCVERAHCTSAGVCIMCKINVIDRGSFGTVVCERILKYIRE